MNQRKSDVQVSTFLAVVGYTAFVFTGGMFLATGGQLTTAGPGDFAFDEKSSDTMEKVVFLKYESFGLNVTEVYTDSHKDFLICVEDRRKRAPSDTIVVQTCTQHEHNGTETRFPQLLSEAGLDRSEVMQYADGVRPKNQSEGDSAG